MRLGSGYDQDTWRILMKIAILAVPYYHQTPSTSVHATARIKVCLEHGVPQEYY